jgi:predicted dehydrogenase
MLGVGIIGGGRVAHAHASATAANSSLLALRGIAELDPERAAGLGMRYGCPSYVDYQAMLARPDIHVVTIALPNVLHASVALDAIAAGKHVFVEKPMALTLEECDAMIAAAEKAGVKLMVGHTQHFFALNLAAHRILSSGELGQLAMLTDTWYKPFGLEGRLPWFLDRTQGGGMWQMNGAHMVDRMLWFANSPVVAVKAWVGNPLLGQQSDDSSLAFLQHANGLCSSLVHAGYRVGAERWEGEFVCTNGMLKLATFAPNAGLWVARTDGYEPVDVTPNSPFNLEFELFARCCIDNTPEPIRPRYARHIVEVLLAVEESARTRREVLIPEAAL